MKFFERSAPSVCVVPTKEYQGFWHYPISISWFNCLQCLYKLKNFLLHFVIIWKIMVTILILINIEIVQTSSIFNLDPRLKFKWQNIHMVERGENCKNQAPIHPLCMYIWVESYSWVCRKKILRCRGYHNGLKHGKSIN